MDVRVLGPLEVDVGGVMVDLGTPRQRAVLAVLVVNANRVVSVDRIIDDVWGEQPPAAVAATLQAYISNLRRVLEPGRKPRAVPQVLVTESPGYVLRLDPGRIDAHCAEDLTTQGEAHLVAGRADAARSAFEAALARWRGDPYANFAYEPFAAAEIERLGEVRLHARTGLARAMAALGELGAAASLVQQAALAHPLREDVRALQMRVLYRLGRQTEALAVYDEVRRLLAEDLGLEPGPELQRAQLQILHHDPLLHPVATGSPATTESAAGGAPVAAGEPVQEGSRRGTTEDVADRGSASRSPVLRPVPLPDTVSGRQLGPMVGRDAELARLDELWAAVRTGQGRVCAVVGPAGIGKTRLIGEFATRVHASGGQVLWGRCTAEPLTRYQPFVEALAPLAATVTANDAVFARPLELLLPGFGSTSSLSPSDIDRYALFSAVAALLREASRAGPVLVVIDDAHWADSSTTALAIHAIRHNVDSPLCIVATYRTDEITGPHPAADALAELQRDRLIDLVTVPGLDRGGVCDLLRHLHPAATDEDLDLVFERTEGNPFFVEELVAASLSVPGKRLDRARVPLSIRAVIDRRVEQLTDSARHQLRAAAVLGREFDSDLLGVLTGCDPIALLDDLEAALALNLVTEVRAEVGRFSFAHALIRQALLDGMSDLRRRRLHRAAAEAIGRRDGRTGRVSAPTEIAHHLLAGGFPEDRETAALHLVDVAEQALEVFAYQEAVDACQQALDADDGALPSSLRCDVLTVLGSAQLAAGRSEQSRATFMAAAELAEAEADGNRLAVVVTRSLLGSGLGVVGHDGVVDTERAALLEKALLLLGETDPAMRVWVLSYLATVLLYAADPTRREQAAAEAVALADSLGPPRLRAAAKIAQRTALEASPGSRLPERLAVAAEARRWADEAGELPLRVVTRLAALDEVLSAGEITLFDRLVDEAEELIAPLGQPRWRWFVETARSGRALLDGRYADAGARMERTLAEAGTMLGDVPVIGWAAQRFLLERDTGRLDETVARLTDEMVQGPERSALRAAACLARAEVGALAEARALFEVDARHGFADVPHGSRWTATMAWFAEAACLLGDRPGAVVIDELLAGREDHVAVVGGGGISGSLGRVRGLVAAHGGELYEAQQLLGAALERMRRVGSPPWIARTAAELAGVRRAAGDTDGAAVLQREAASIAAGLGLVLR